MKLTPYACETMIPTGKGSVRVRRGPDFDNALDAIKWCGTNPRRWVMALQESGYVTYRRGVWNGGKRMDNAICAGADQ